MSAFILLFAKNSVPNRRRIDGCRYSLRLIAFSFLVLVIALKQKAATEHAGRLSLERRMPIACASYHNIPVYSIADSLFGRHIRRLHQRKRGTGTIIDHKYGNVKKVPLPPQEHLSETPTASLRGGSNSNRSICEADQQRKALQRVHYGPSAHWSASICRYNQATR